MIASICLRCKLIYDVKAPEEPGLEYSHGICSLECTLILYPDFIPETNHVSGMETQERPTGAIPDNPGPGVGKSGGAVYHNPLAF
jgi:hypothetical protein